MAKDNFWENDAPVAADEFWKSDKPAAQRDLPAGVTPSTAGAGRGSVSPEAVAPVTLEPTKGRSGSVMEEVIIPDPQLDPELNRQAMLKSGSPNSVMFTAGRGKQNADQMIAQGAALEAQAKKGRYESVPDMLEAQVQSDRRKKFAQENPNISAAASGAANMLKGSINAPGAMAGFVNKTVVDPVLGMVGAGTMPSVPVALGTDDLNAMTSDFMPAVAKLPLEKAWSTGVFGEWLAANVSAQVPQLGGQIAGVVNPVARAAILPTMGAQAAGGSYADGDDPRVAVAKGVLEVLSEGASFGVADKIKDVILKLPQGAQQAVFANIAKRAMAAGGAITGQMLAGAVEESVAQIGGNALDIYVSGQNKPLMDKVGDSAVIGAFAEAGMGLPNAGYAMRDNSPQAQVQRELSQTLDGGNPRAEDIARQKGFLAREQRIKTLSEAGDTAAADLLQKKHERLSAIEEVDGELQRMPGTPKFANSYRTLRGTGMKPAEAAARSAVTTTFQGFAIQAGIPNTALTAALNKANGMPLDEAPAFLQKFTAALEKRGMAQPGAINLSEQLEAARDDAIEAAMEAVYSPESVQAVDNIERILNPQPASTPREQGNIRQTMNDVLALEQQDGTPSAVSTVPAAGAPLQPTDTAGAVATGSGLESEFGADPARTVSPNMVPPAGLSGGVPDTAVENDWMQTLFGGAATPASPAATPTTQAKKIDAPTLRSAIGTLTTDLQMQRDDWASRDYKANGKQIELNGDGPSSQGSMSVSAINEGKRAKVVQAVDDQLKQLGKLDEQLKTPEGEKSFTNLVQSTWDRAQAFKPQSPDQLSGGALFESLMIDALKLQPAQGSYTSLPITKSLRSLMESPNVQNPQAPALPAPTQAPGETPQAVAGNAATATGVPATRAGSVESGGVTQPAFTSELRPSGTLSVQGDFEAVKRTLTAGGIDPKKITKSTTGAVVGASQARQAQEILNKPQEPANAKSPEAIQDQTQQSKAPAAGVIPVVAKPKTKPAGARNLRAAAYDKNPLMTFLATHGLFHDKTRPNSQKSEFSPDRGIMIMGYGPVFKRTGKHPSDLVVNAIQDGYLPQDGTVDQLHELIRRAVAGEKISPMYAEGVAEQMGQDRIDAQPQYEDFLDTAQQDPMDSDQFGPLDLDILDQVGFNDATPEIQAEFKAIIALAEIKDIDAEMILMEVTDQVGTQATQQEFYETAITALKAAVEASTGNGSEVSGAQGPEVGPTAEEGLTAPTRAEVLEQQAQREAEDQRQKDGGDKPIERKVTGDTPDMFNTQASVFDVPVEPAAQPQKPVAEMTPSELLRAAAAKPAPATQANAEASISDIPPGMLKKITVNVEQAHQGEGIKTVSVPAGQALADNQSEIDAYRKLLACVGG